MILNGELHDKEYNDFVEPGRENWDYPCTLAGITKDGKKLFLITVDKATMVEIAYYLVSQGAWNVVNFDGGGSATMVVNGDVVNNPTDGRERAVRIHSRVFHMLRLMMNSDQLPFPVLL